MPGSTDPKENDVVAPDFSRRAGALGAVTGLCLALVTTAVGAEDTATTNYSPVARTGTVIMSEWTEAVKTPEGKQFRRYQAEYDWDTGLMHRHEYDADGVHLSTRTLKRTPTPSEEEIAEAIDIVRGSPEVIDIQRRQAGLKIDGGFTIRQTKDEGPCHGNARCLQIFLFDGENVVRHMLVDLRANTIVDHDYVPPRNRGVAQ